MLSPPSGPVIKLLWKRRRWGRRGRVKGERDLPPGSKSREVEVEEARTRSRSLPRSGPDPPRRPGAQRPSCRRPVRHARASVCVRRDPGRPRTVVGRPGRPPGARDPHLTGPPPPRGPVDLLLKPPDPKVPLQTLVSRNTPENVRPYPKGPSKPPFSFPGFWRAPFYGNKPPRLRPPRSVVLKRGGGPVSRLLAATVPVAQDPPRRRPRLDSDFSTPASDPPTRSSPQH